MIRKSRSKARSNSAPSVALTLHTILEVEADVFKDSCLLCLYVGRNLDQQIIVTKQGEPVARLTAAYVGTPSAFGFMRGTILGEEDIIAPDLDAW